MRGRNGFTLIELMVSVALLGIVAMYLMQTFTTQHKAYTIVDQVTEIQQNARAVAALLERDLRHAGIMVPEAAAVCGIDQTNGPDTLFVTDADAIDPGGDITPDFGARLPITDTNVVSGPQTINVNSFVVEPAPLRAAYDTDANGVNDSDFQMNAGVIVVDSNNADRGAACGVLTANPTGGDLDVNILSNPLAGGGAAPRLVAVPAHVYTVNNQLQLLRDGMVLAEGVEDLQVAYFFDANGNRQVDPNEYRGDGTAPNYVANAVDGSDVREVRANLVFRTRLPDPENTQGQFQVTENRVGPAGNDGFRRRVHTATVWLRNVGNR
jgi:prepilin-type N-terminal cleavage/methylation domain-containing protein